MKALRYYGIKNIRFEEIPEPRPAEDKVLVNIIYAGICGSDLHIYKEGMFMEHIPETMGHEFAGKVVTAPEGCGFLPGDLVTGDPRVPCGECPACAGKAFHRCLSLGFIGEVSPGAFSEYLAIEPSKLVKFSPEVDPGQGVLAEPLAVAVHAVERIMNAAPQKVLVVGGGPIGLLIATLLKNHHHLNHVAVADIDGFRRRKAMDAGADVTYETLKEAEDAYEYVVDAVGSPGVMAEIISSILPGGQIFISAIYEKLPTLDLNLVVGKELSLTGNNAYSFEDLEKAVGIINAGAIDLSWMVTTIYPISQGEEAFKSLIKKEKQDLKIVIDPRR
ncbi:MAG: Zn-dependent oxidoreductase [delta proteobacterium ML8_F1]|nr:MAG: Zn-dependent oxidoreductase [delta proteobacterium ML8_F1]